MNKKLLLLLLVATSLNAVAQPTLTAATSTPHTGDVHRYYNCDTVSPGPSGASQTWDFSGIDTISGLPGGYSACPAAPYCDTFAGSDLAGVIAGGLYTYYKTTSNTLSINGLHLTGFIKFTDPEDLFHYPMSYSTNNTFSDTFAANYQAGHNYLRNGRVYDTADGWGLLKLPTGNFSNVLRVKRVEMYRDSDLNDVVGTGYRVESYTWYSANNRDLLLQITLPVLVNNFPTGTLTVEYTNQMPTGINNLDNTITGITLSPNPAKENLNITFTEALTEQVNISLTDAMGREMMHGITAKGAQQTRFNTSGLPAGVYFIRFKNTQGTTVRKVEIL